MSSESSPKILTVGDISFRGRWENRPDSSPFKNIREQFTRSSFVVGNLESPLVADHAAPVAGKCTLRGDAGWAMVLKDCGIHLVSLANNHLMDFGEPGLASTLQALETAGISCVGAGRDAEAACAPVFKKVSGKKFAFLARSSVEVSSRCYAGPDQAGVALLDEAELSDSVAGCREKADFVVVLLHWGMEHYHYPSPRQRLIAEKLAAAGVDIVLGHHPHVLQGEQKIGTALVSYSSGNFLFDEFPWSYVAADGQERSTRLALSEANRKGMMLEISISGTGELSTRQIFSRISEDAHVCLDGSPGRHKEYRKFCDRLHLPFYDQLWKIYSLKREWDLRLKHQYSPRIFLKKIHKLRPRHFGELTEKLKRASRISSGKTTNPYE